MTLVSSGILYLGPTVSSNRNIRAEIEGAVGPYTLITARDNADGFSGTTGMQDFYGYTQPPDIVGRLYAAENWSGGSIFAFLNSGYVQIAVGSGPVLVGTATSSPQSMVFFKDNEDDITETDNVGVIMSRRTAGSNNAWSSYTFIDPYVSFDTLTLDYTTYDYYAQVGDGTVGGGGGG